MTRVIYDPVTRVGGHLRLEVVVENGAVVDAWSSGTMFRGMESILRGRDPRDAWLLAQRVCGVCVGAHGLASVRAVEAALGVTIPPNARLVRNILAGTSFVIDHVAGFYQRAAIDWVDLEAALGADPARTAALVLENGVGGPNTSVDYFRGMRDRLTRFVAGGRTGPFAGAVGGHSAMHLAPEVGLLLLTHYVESLDWMRRMGRIEAILGGKSPHPQTLLVGGMTLMPPWAGAKGAVGGHPDLVDRNMPSALAADGMAEIATYLDEMETFVDGTYVPDILRLARAYPEWSAIGVGTGMYLAYGEFPESDVAGDWSRLLPGGWVTTEAPLVPRDVDANAITETVAHSWYAPDTTSRRPSEAITAPRYEAPLPLTTLESSDRYSWLKAPRYQGSPMEVGPLARVLVGYAQGGHEIRAVLDGLLATLGARRDALAGTLGRTLARAVETDVVVRRLPSWMSELRASLAGGDLAFADVTRWNPETWPDRASGFSLGESGRGAVGHWVTIRDRRIESYAIVDATTWNASPRDERGTRGPLEEALVGTPVADPERPVEILRTVHSFDPCTACGVHLWDPAHGSPALSIVTRRSRR